MTEIYHFEVSLERVLFKDRSLLESVFMLSTFATLMVTAQKKKGTFFFTEHFGVNRPRVFQKFCVAASSKDHEE